MNGDEHRGTGRCFVDTNLFVYAHDRTAGRKREAARALISSLWESREGCVSVQVLQELFVNLTRKVPKPLTAQEAMNLISDISHWRTHAPRPADVLSAIELHEKIGVSFRDTMILTSARALDCGILYSDDLNPGQTYAGVLVVNPLQE
jgi:predicted nucleic acid-binding protein